MKKRVSRLMAAVLAASMSTGSTALLPGPGLVFRPPSLTAGAADLVSGNLTYVETATGITITGCTGNATRLTIPAAIGGKPVTSIGKKAFYANTELTSVIIPGSVKEIGEEAFSGCVGLESAELSEGLETIGYYAFYLTGITEIILPSTLKTCAAGFSGCGALEMVTFANSTKAVPDDCLQDNRALVEVVMPDTVKSIGSNAFKNCENLKGVSLPKKLTAIGKGAFSGSGLTEIAFPSTLEKCEGGFTDCRTLKKAVFANGTKTVPYRCMSGAKALKDVSIPGTVTTISAEAFKDCTGLRSVTLPEGLQIIRNNAFGGTSLTEITLPSTLTICEAAFKNCFSLKTAAFADGIDSIPYNCFGNTASLEKVVIPDSVRTIGSSAFAGTVSLRSIVFPDILETIESDAFENSGLINVTIPDSVTKLGASAFKSCRKLKTAAVGKGVTAIENGVFSEDTALESVTLPAAVKSFSFNAFGGCVELEDISYPGKAGSFKAENTSFRGCYSLRDSRFVHLDFSGTEFTADKTKAARGARVAFIASFAAEKKSSGEHIVSLNVPDGFTVDPDSVTILSGAALNQYEFGEENLVTFVTDSGSVRFEAIAGAAGDCTVSADLRDAKTGIDEPIGKADISVSDISISVPGTTGTLSPVISGRGPEGKSINVYMNGRLIATAAADVKTGIFSFVAKLPANTPDGTKFTFCAKESGGVSEDAVMVYSTKQPAIKSVKFSTGSGDTDITGAFTSGKTSVLYAPPTAELRFKLDITNTNLVDSVYATAYVDGALRSIKARYNTAEGLWIASGNFGGVPRDVNFVVVSSTDAGAGVNLEKGFFTSPGNVVFLSAPSGKVCDAETSKPIAGAELSLVGIDEDGIQYSFDLSKFGQKEHIYTDAKGEYFWNLPAGEWKIICTAEGYETAESKWFSVPYDSQEVSFSLEKPGTEATDVQERPAAEVPAEPPAETPVVAPAQKPIETVPAEYTPVTIVPEESGAYTETPVAEFIEGVHNWSFANTSANFKSFGNTDYFMTDKDYEKLITGLSNSEIERIDSKRLSKWTGSCYGIADLSLLACYGVFDVSWVDPSADSPFTASVPPTENVISAINYYHLAQLTDYISACRNKAIYDTPEQVKCQFVIDEINSGHPVLIPFHCTYTGTNGNLKRAAHVIVGYAVEDGSFNQNGTVYNKKIITSDPNCVGFKEDACMYINTEDGSWIVPRYLYKGADSKLDAQLGCCTSDIGILNYHSLFDKTGGLDAVQFTPFVNILAVNSNYSIDRAILNDDGTYNICDGMNDVVAYADVDGFEDEDSQDLNFILDDTDKAYVIRLGEKDDVDLTLRTGTDLIRLRFDGAEEIIVDPSGMVRATGDRSGFTVNMISNDGCSPTDWNSVEVSGECAQVEFRKMGEGYALIGDDLTNVSVSAEGANAQPGCQFSTEYDTVLIHEITEDQIGVSADADRNGSFELQLLDIPGLTGMVGDTNGDNITDANDASEILSLYAMLSTGNGDVSDKAKTAGDVNKDGLLDSADASLILEFYAAASTSSDITAEKFFRDRTA